MRIHALASCLLLLPCLAWAQGEPDPDGGHSDHEHAEGDPEHEHGEGDPGHADGHEHADGGEHALGELSERMAPGEIPMSEHVHLGLEVVATSDGEVHRPRDQVQQSYTRYAFVGETPSSWLVEYTDPSMDDDPPGTRMCLQVKKASGHVQRAYFGSPEQPLRSVPIAPRYPAPEEEPGVKEGTITTDAGTFEVEVVVTPPLVSWLGAESEGLAAGIMIRSERGKFRVALIKVHDPIEVVLSETKTVQAVQFEYDSGLKIWLCDDPILSTFFPQGTRSALVKIEGVGYRGRVESLRSDAKPTVPWPGWLLKGEQPPASRPTSQPTSQPTSRPSQD